ncbi:MAG: flagellar biosynthesis anti-sigma factor FlgM [Pseudomonadota bacterium]|nr:flagellar biosynthesis anti-sigma factor FlgM [Pseudomonadota bacterium]
MSIDIPPIGGSRHERASRSRGTPSTPNDGSKPGTAPGAAAPDTQVELSDHAQTLQRLQQAIQAGDPVRLDVVDQLRHQIATAEYEVDSPKVAEKILEAERMLKDDA